MEMNKVTCGSCGAGQATKKCGGCMAVRYCSEQCQRAHWPSHKSRCRELKAAAAASSTAAEVYGCWACDEGQGKICCNSCKVAAYCSLECQDAHRMIHKGRCTDLKELGPHLLGFKKGKNARVNLGEDLKSACILGRLSVVERLVATGTSANYSNCPGGVCPLACAATDGHSRVVDFLVQRGALVDNKGEGGFTALYLACEYGQLKVVVALLRHGAQIDSTDDEGCSALYIAAKKNHPEVVTLLCEKGAKIDQADCDDSTPLLAAAVQGHTTVVKLLLDHGARIDAVNCDSMSPLLAACFENKIEVVTLLCERGANVNLAGLQRVNALSICALNGHTACVRVLLLAGADPLHRTDHGNALDAALRSNHREIVALLKARIAELGATP